MSRTPEEHPAYADSLKRCYERLFAGSVEDTARVYAELVVHAAYAEYMFTAEEADEMIERNSEDPEMSIREIIYGLQIRHAGPDSYSETRAAIRRAGEHKTANAADQKGERVVRHYDKLRATLDRSRFNGRIHVIYLSSTRYLRAVVERDGKAELWWLYGDRWKRNTGRYHPAVPMNRSRAAKNAPWDGSLRYA